MVEKYKLHLEFDGPPASDNFMPALLIMKIKKLILDELNRQEEYRLSKLEKLYNLKEVKIESYVDPDRI